MTHPTANGGRKKIVAKGGEERKYIDALSRMLDPRFREIEPSAGDMGCVELLVKSVDRESRRVTAIVSTPEVDRYQEIIEPQAFAKWLSHFQANPVCLAGHDHVAFGTSEPTVIGRWVDVKITDAGMEATVEFAQTPLAELYWSLYRDAFMRAFSVGFIGRAWEMREMAVGEGSVTKRLRVWTEVELLEISAVAVPANRGALARAAAFGARGATDEPGAGEAQSGGVIDYAKLADAIIEGGLGERIDKQINQVLTDPDGPVEVRMRETVAHFLAAGSCGHDHDEQPPRRAADGGLSEALRAIAEG